MEVTTIGELKRKIAEKVAEIEVWSEEIAVKQAERSEFEDQLSGLIEELTEVARQEGADIYKHKQSILDALNKPKRERGRPAKAA